MIKTALDANALSSGAVGFQLPQSTTGQLVRDWQGGYYRLVISDHLFAEVERTLAKPYFRARLSPARISAFLQMLMVDATFVQLTETVVGVATYPEHDLVLATAASARADFLVTGDHDLLRLGTFRETVIVSPRDFLAMLPGL
jgi:putative PIN family toxin of toxin-antitoxin system